MGHVQGQFRGVALLLVGVLLASYAACVTPAYAEPRVLPPGTEVQLPRDGERFTLEAPRWLVSRAQLDRANASAEMEKRLTRDLMQCSGALAEASQPEPAWQVGAKWAAWGLSVGAAFALGILVAK